MTSIRLLLYTVLLLASQLTNAEGPRVQFNFANAPLELVIGQLNQSSGVEYALDPLIKEKVNLKYDAIELNKAIELLKKEYKLIAVKQGNRVLLTRAKPKSSRNKKTNNSQSKGNLELPIEPHILRVYTPLYMASRELASLLDPRLGGVLSTTSKVREEHGNNQLIISTTLLQHQQVEDLLKEIDKKRQRVRVYSRIVIMRKKAQHELGTRLGIRAQDGYTALAGGDKGTFLSTTQTNTFTNNLAVDFGVIAHGGKFALGYKNQDSLIEFEFQALETSGLIDVVATPQVMVNSGQLAYIATGVQIPYLDGDDVLFKDALLSLQVTPRVESLERINLSIQFAMDTVGALYNGVPAINTNKLSTKIQIPPDQTLVLGGIYSMLKDSTKSKVPVLGDIPLLGNLFRYESVGLEEAELLIFLTPELATE